MFGPFQGDYSWRCEISKYCAHTFCRRFHSVFRLRWYSSSESRPEVDVVAISDEYLADIIHLECPWTGLNEDQACFSIRVKWRSLAATKIWNNTLYMVAWELPKELDVPNSELYPSPLQLQRWRQHLRPLSKQYHLKSSSLGVLNSYSQIRGHTGLISLQKSLRAMSQNQ